jgi:hypothetical protein
MSQTDEFRKIAEEHGVSVSAVEQLYDALRSTGGGMAQFSHPDLGGYGQWMRGGMIMVGDMFNHGLKAKVNALCIEIADLAASSRDDLAENRGGRSFFGPAKSWWPAEFGNPSSTGGQNQLEYAYFPESHRVVVSDSGDISVFDATGYEVHGFSQQQQNNVQGLHLSSNRGLVPVLSLPRAGAPGVANPVEGN